MLFVFSKIQNTFLHASRSKRRLLSARPFRHYYLTLDPESQQKVVGYKDEEVLFCSFDGRDCTEHVQFRIDADTGYCWEFHVNDKKVIDEYLETVVIQITILNTWETRKINKYIEFIKQIYIQME